MTARPTPAQATHIADALRDAATCYRDGAPSAAADHLARADLFLALHGATAELRGQVQAVQSFAFLGLTTRAAEAAEQVAATTERVYA